MHLAQRQTEHLMGGGPTLRRLRLRAPGRCSEQRDCTAALRVPYPFPGSLTLSWPATSILKHELGMSMMTPREGKPHEHPS